tara:strand:- start:36999 stop:37286 length:288 start_codon:yes stop_codon:yes gene_type:complete
MNKTISPSSRKEIREILTHKCEKILESYQSDQYVSKDNYEEYVRHAEEETTEYFLTGLERDFDQECNDWGFDKIEEFDQDNFKDLLIEEIENFIF